MIKSYRSLVKEFQLFRTHGLVQSDALRESNQEHRAILTALESREPQTAYEASFRHVQHGKQRMFAAFDKLTQTGAAELRKGAAEPRPIE